MKLIIIISCCVAILCAGIWIGTDSTSLEIYEDCVNNGIAETKYGKITCDAVGGY